MENPLLDNAPLPAFSRIRPEQVEPAIDQLLADGRSLVAELAARADQATWETFVDPIEEEDNRLSRAWSPVSHLNSVMNTDALRAAYNACLPKLSDYASEVGQNQDLYRGYKRVSEQAGLNAAQRKMLQNTLRDLHLAGVDLPADKKARYREINQELSQLTSKFAENVLDASNAWHKQLESEDRLAGLPAAAKALARQHAKERDLDGWVLTLDFPSFEPVMRYAEDRDLRREVYEAFTTRASDLGPHAGQWDNSEASCLYFQFNGSLQRSGSQYQLGEGGAVGVILVRRQSHGSQNTDDRNNDHQFDQGKTILLLVRLHLHRFLHSLPRVVSLGLR